MPLTAEVLIAPIWEIDIFGRVALTKEAPNWLIWLLPKLAMKFVGSTFLLSRYVGSPLANAWGSKAFI